jgi:type I restriction enzyme S subunit
MRREWKSFTLDQLGEIGRGRSRHRPRNDPALYGGAYPFFQTGDITHAEFYLHDFSATYNEAGLAQSKMWKPGTLCITIAANIADTAILSIPGCFPDSVVGFTADPALADTRFIKYHIDLMKRQMQDVSRGTTQDNLSLDKLLRFEFCVPHVAHQAAIAEVLIAYDDLIEKNTRRIAILEEMARRIFEEWFVHFRAPGCEGLPMVESAIGPVPQGWDVVSVGAVLSEQIGGTWGTDGPTKETPYAGYVIRGTDFPRLGAGFYSQVPLRFVSDNHLRSRALKDGDLVIEVSGGSKDQPVGRTTLIDADLISAFPEPILFASFCRMMRPDTCRVSPFFLSEYMRRQYQTRAILTYQKQSTGISNLRFSDFAERSLLVLPPTSLMTRYTETVAPSFALASKLRRQAADLRAQRDLLLPKLISGEIEIDVRSASVREAAE